MNVEYFLWLNEEVKGPFTISQLKGMWSNGQLTGDTLFSTGGETWNPLREILTLLEPVKPPPIPKVISSPVPIVFQAPIKKASALNGCLSVVSALLIALTVITTLWGFVCLFGNPDYAGSTFVMAIIFFVITLISIGVTKIG